LRCEEARRRLLVSLDDAEACDHLAACDACLVALEAADPLVPLLRSARPEHVAPPAGLTARVLAAWRGRWSWQWKIAVPGVAGAAALAWAVVQLGVVAAWPAYLVFAASAVLDGIVTWLGALVAFRTLLLGAPELLAVFGALTLAVGALWVRVALAVPSWRSAR
jgi:hypothetical protein